MKVVHIDAGPKDFYELSQSVTPFRQSVLVRRQVAGDDGWTHIVSISQAWRNVKRKGSTEGRASSQVGGRVSLLGALREKIRVVTGQEIEIRWTAGSVTKVAIVRAVDQIAA